MTTRQQQQPQGPDNSRPLQSRREEASQNLWARVTKRASRRRRERVDMRGALYDATLEGNTVPSVTTCSGPCLSDADADEFERELEAALIECTQAEKTMKGATESGGGGVSTILAN